LGERKSGCIRQLSHLSHVKIEGDKTAAAKRDLIVIHKIDFTAKNLTSNAGIYLLLENAKTHGIFELMVPGSARVLTTTWCLIMNQPTKSR